MIATNLTPDAIAALQSLVDRAASFADERDSFAASVTLSFYGTGGVIVGVTLTPNDQACSVGTQHDASTLETALVGAEIRSAGLTEIAGLPR